MNSQSKGMGIRADIRCKQKTNNVSRLNHLFAIEGCMLCLYL